MDQQEALRQEALRQEALRQLYENPCTESLLACYEAFQDRLIQLYQTVEQHIISVQEEEGRHRQLGVVLDIDETVLFNDPDCVHRNPYMGPFLDLFQRLGVLVYFVTGRLSQHRDTTLRQLESLDFERGRDFEELFCKPKELYGVYPEENVVPEEGLGSVSLFKRDMRYFIADKHDVVLVLSMGDQYSDVNGDHAPSGEVRHPNLRHIQWIKLFSTYDIP